MLCSLADVDTLRIRTGRLRELDFSRITDAARRLKSAPIWFDDRSRGLREVVSVIRWATARRAIRLAVIDYVQLVTTESRGSLYERTTEASRTLKLLAGEVGIPLVVLSQLNREAKDVEPEVWHLKESGGLEQDADLVLLLWPASDDILNVKVAKQRNGPTGTLQLKFEKQYARFEDLAPPASMYDVNGQR
jgi:replicative DNA helicase